MPGATDTAYVLARRVLLDALDALREHRHALILVGAQAIYLHTGEADIAVAPFTTDADLAIDPSALQPDPKLAAALENGGFFTKPDSIGIWTSSTTNVSTDFLVPEAATRGGRRSADLGVHGNKVARKVRGLEPALIDKSPLRIEALEDADRRSSEIMVAGPTALLIAKLHKLYERRGQPSRLKNKDALDVYRLLQATETHVLADTIRSLASDRRASASTQMALQYLKELFASPVDDGSRMAGEAVETLQDPEVIAAACAALTADLLRLTDDLISS